MQAVKPVLALRVCAELATKVVIGLVFRILEVVFAVSRRLPDVEDSIGNRLLGKKVADGAVHESDLASRRNTILNDATSELAERRVRAPERP